MTDHTDGDFAYPILLDPVIDQQLFLAGDNINGWQYGMPHPDFYSPSTQGSWGTGLYWVSGGNRFYGHGTYGQWAYHPPGNAFIYEANFAWERQQTNSPNQAICMTYGLTLNGGFHPGTAWNAHDGAFGSGPPHPMPHIH